MSVRITELTDNHCPAVKSFNDRLRAGGMKMQFPVQETPSWLPASNSSRLFEEQYVALDQQQEVRGGYILKHQEFKIGDEIVPIGNLRLPISEGVVDRRYASLASELLFDAMGRQRLLFGLGLGGYEEAVTKLFQAARWQVFTVPFFFTVQHPFRFCRSIRFLRRSLLRRFALDVAAYSGAAAAGFKFLQSAKSKSQVRPDLRVEIVSEFDKWSDEVWSRCQSQYGMIAVRDSHVLRLLYPRADSRFLRLKVFDGKQLLGWAVMLDTQMTGHRQFGSLRLGSFVDGLAAIDDAAVVVGAAADHLAKRGVDLIVANHSHARWGDAFRRSGFLSGPSNFIFAGSRALDKLLSQLDIEKDAIFLTRGDGDGPINL